MRAVLLTGHGGLERLDYREDVPAPVPAAGEVLVRIRAAAVNNTDINARTAWYSKTVRAATDGHNLQADANADDAGWTGAAMPFPRIQGADGCGEVVAVGPGIAETRIGTRVLLDPVLRCGGTAANSFGYIGTDRDGCFAEFVAVPDANACAVSSKLSDVELASFPCSYTAAENMLARAMPQPCHCSRPR
jgi:NADPH:quinone reductase-like Zn-dependent oxidoreductase